MSDTALRDAASAGAAEAIAQLTALAGGRSMCTIGRSGESFPAAKYLEGRWAAFDEAARRLGRGGTRSDIEQLQASWNERRDAAPPGDWNAYWSGGSDALAVLAADEVRVDRGVSS